MLAYWSIAKHAKINQITTIAEKEKKVGNLVNLFATKISFDKFNVSEERWDRKRERERQKEGVREQITEIEIQIICY